MEKELEDVRVEEADIYLSSEAVGMIWFVAIHLEGISVHLCTHLLTFSATFCYVITLNSDESGTRPRDRRVDVMYKHVLVCIIRHVI